jgi:peroxiredoxin
LEIDVHHNEGENMQLTVYQGTIEMLLNNDAFVREFLLGVRKKDFSRLINEGIFAKLFIENTYSKDFPKPSLVTGDEEDKAA